MSESYTYEYVEESEEEPDIIEKPTKLSAKQMENLKKGRNVLAEKKKERKDKIEQAFIRLETEKLKKFEKDLKKRTIEAKKALLKEEKSKMKKKRKVVVESSEEEEDDYDTAIEKIITKPPVEKLTRNQMMQRCGF